MRVLTPILLFCLQLTALAQEPVSATLLANRDQLEKGEPFLLGIQLKMNDHWHTYWENPGFAGLPPSWNLEAVEGLVVSELLYPWPERWTDEEGFVSYGYNDVVIIYAHAIYSGNEPEITIKGLASWVACKQMCIAGDGEISLSLKVGKAKNSNEAAFAKYIASTPVPFTSKLPFSYSASMNLEKERWHGTLTLTPKVANSFKQQDGLVLFPLPNDNMADLKLAQIKFVDGSYRVALEYEAYDEVPSDYPINVAVKVLASDGQQIYARLQLNPSEKKLASQAASGAEQVEDSSNGLFWYFMFAAFIGGMILNLMPCVLPVLSLKVFSLLKEAGESRARRIQFGWVYTLGILVSFLIISGFFITAKAAGQQLGIGFQFQSPVFVIAISILIFVMGLSFLGVFHIGQLNSDALHGLSQRSGYQGAFFNGALMTLLSTPCTAPMLGAAYGWALSQSNLIILLTFSIISLGLAFPYLILCYFPSLLKFLPKPGAWMVQFKISMGFLLLATLVWLFSVLSELTGTTGVVGLLASLLAVAVACYIFGQTWYGDRRLRGLLAMCLILFFGGYIGMFQLFDIQDPKAAKRVHLENMRLTFLSEQGSTKGLEAALDEMITTRQKIAWVPYSSNNLEYFRKQDRLIFVDFTAAWCTTCIFNEKRVINTKKMRAIFEDNQVVTLKADYTDKNDKLTKILRGFDRAGVPLYLVYPGESDPILLPEVITDNMLIEALSKARAQVERRAKLNSNAE